MSENMKGAKVALSILEFCSVAGIGRSRAYEEIKAGRLRIIKCGRRTLVPVEAVRTWLGALGA
jgi:excisionase family DNA binding protein